MNKKEILEILSRWDMHPSRKLGQNFLIDPNMLSALVSDAAPQKGERVLEVGPGLGMLTEALLAAEVDLTCVELDHRLAEYLRERFAGRKNFRLLEGDACKVDLDELMGEAPYRCIANLPYSCSTPFLANVISRRNIPTDLCVLLQLEMAERLGAPAGTHEYGAPSIRIGLRYETKILRLVDPKVFFPPPEVKSAFVKLTHREVCPDEALRRKVGELVGALFQQRRKKSSRTLQNAFPAVDAVAALAAAGLREDVRPDCISMDEYLALGKIYLEREGKG